jgi:Zn-dependent peptidase ImmA (M78 family)
MTSTTDDPIEELARALRVALEVDDQLRPNMIEVIETLKCKGYIADYIRVPDNLMIDAEARFNPDERKLYLRESIYRSAVQGKPRSRWTIAHEIGHVALQHQQIRNRSTFNVEIERRVASIRRDEFHAHKFAAAFLAPFHRAEFTLETTPAQLAERFGVSMVAAARRIEELAPMYRHLHGLKRPLPPGVLDFLRKAQRKGAKITSLEPLEIEPKSPRYEGDPCPTCGNFRMVRLGTSAKCDYCGTTTGVG